MPPRTTRAPRKMTITPLEVEKTSGVSSGSQKSLWPVVMVLAMLFLIATSIAGYFYYQYKHSAEVADTKEIEDLVEQIGQVMLLPEGMPTLATVTDREKLAEQPFFQKAENGDKVLIYSESGRAILYRPSQKKIVDVTVVNVNQPQAEVPAPVVTEPETQTQTAPSTPTITRIALYNGSTTVGVTSKVESQLKQVSNALAVVTKENAKKNDYEETFIIDSTGQNASMATQIAQALGGTLATLPAGEVFPADTDILVIIGKE